MKNSLYLLFLAFLCTGCFDDSYQDQNLIPDITFSVNINLNLPAYQDLLVPSGFVVLSREEGYGHRGIIVFNTGNGEQSVDQYLAFDLACPHIEVQSCSQPMDVSSFPEMTNACETDGIYYRFDLGRSYTYKKNEEGQSIPIPEGEVVYDLQQYRVDQVSGKELRISNF